MIRANLLLLLIAGSMLCGNASAQHHYTAQLGKVDSNGFYKIYVPPDIRALSKPDIADLRITDDKGNKVPYVFLDGAGTRQSFREFPIISSATDTGGNTILEIKNILAPEACTSLWLLIKNAAVLRRASLSGRNGTGPWYAIREEMTLEENDGENGEKLQSIHFPQSSYSFFRLAINNAHKDPLNIMAAGLLQTESHAEPPLRLSKAPALKRVDSSDGNTYITVVQDKAYPIDAWDMKVSSPAIYERKVSWFVKHSREWLPAGAYQTVSSKNATGIYNINLHDKELMLQIQNGDNPQLEIRSLALYTRPIWIYSYLEKNRQYALTFSDRLATKPIYDMQAFTGQIPLLIPELIPGSVVPVSQRVGQINAYKNFGNLALGMHRRGGCYLGILYIKVIKGYEPVRLYRAYTLRYKR